MDALREAQSSTDGVPHRLKALLLSLSLPGAIVVILLMAQWIPATGASPRAPGVEADAPPSLVAGIVATETHKVYLPLIAALYAPPVCGDAECTAGENCETCASDCGACTCGDGRCSPSAGESASTCPQDCAASNGTPCDDGDPCTEDDEYQEGVCSGTPMVCDDELACTDDACAAGECQFTVQADACLIAGACHADQEENPACECQLCSPSSSQKAWWPAACYQSSETACDGLDNDCDGTVDEDNAGGGASCDTSQDGVCAAGHMTCTGGELLCVRDQEPSSEVCNGLDDDCDGAEDESFPGMGEPCDTLLPGECATGSSACSAGQPTCAQLVYPSTEVCDGKDNDCDGSVDDGNPGGGAYCTTGLSGVCEAGHRNCIGGVLLCVQDQDPSSEVCDSLDNDCDGSTDEDFNLQTDVNNCGSCGNGCNDQHPGAPTGSTAAYCQAGICAFSCLGNYYDVNGTVSDGCECLDTEVYSTMGTAQNLGPLDDCGTYSYTRSGKLPHDDKHPTASYKEWYYFTYDDSPTCAVEFLVAFRSPPGTVMKLTLRDLFSERQSVTSIGDWRYLVNSELTGGTYWLGVEWLSGNSCSTYEMEISDGY